MPYARSKYVQTMHAIASFATAAHDDAAVVAATGLNPFVSTGRNAVKLWEVPSAAQLQAQQGTPFLAVRFGKLAGYGVGGVLESADMAAQGPSTSEPYWDWELFILHPYDEADPNYEDAANDMTLMMQTFNDPANHTLGGATQFCYVADATPAYVELVDGTPLTAAYLVIRTSEFLLLS